MKPSKRHSRQEKWQSKQAAKRETSWHVWGAARRWADESARVGWTRKRSQERGQEIAGSGLAGSLDLCYVRWEAIGGFSHAWKWAREADSYETLRQSKWKMMQVWGGTPQNWNYLLEGGPLVVHRLPPLDECSRNPSVLLALLWESLFGFSEFFWKTFNTFAHFMMGDLWAHLPTLRWVFSSFWPKNGMTPVPHPPYSPNLSPSDIFVSWDEKSPRREPWQVWLSGLSAGLWTKRSLDWFPIRAHPWVVGHALSWGLVRGNWWMYLSHIHVSLPRFLPPCYSL